MNFILKKVRFEYLKLCIFILFAVIPLYGQLGGVGSISGTITNSSGHPISGVKVCTSSLSCTMSNEDGRYVIYKASRSIRFSYPGYIAITKDASDEQIDIVLQKSTKESDNKLTLSLCSENDNLIGGRKFKIVVPSKNIIKSNDIDYEMMVVSSSKNTDEYLVLMQGGNVSSGMPSWRASLKESPVIIYDRDIDYIHLVKLNNELMAMLQMTLTIDTKAQASNGKFWRYIGGSSEIITV